ncbi:intraflagellar transport protein 52 homolog [Agrilus planipennis]|uniref:Intraflagellar transport protein 52 homolog n=1 Tax=Agrilus planipennis TaxID=224129 RepID=A0A1W4WPF9_AGRPL|nr:intraflagellar transport protein 52 homolog [Agrilus planipennis]
MIDNKHILIFNASKNEVFKLNENYKILQRKLKTFWKLQINKEEVTETLLKNCNLLILPAPQAAFNENEIESMKKYLNNGGNILVLLSETNDNDKSNINILLEEYGIVPNMDYVIRTHYYKYFHPKECYISDSSINSALNKDKLEISLVYPYGCTLDVSKPSVVAFTSGVVSFPVDRPLGALYYGQSTGGKLVAIGSGHMFSDKYIDQEQNEKFREMIFDFFTSDDVKELISEYDEIDVWDYHIVPDTPALAEQPKLTLTDGVGQNIPADYSKLFDYKMHSISTCLVTEAIKLYENLEVKHEPLKLITPSFEAPLPPLQPAVFPPTFRELSPPPLELFDLDEAFSSVFSRLAQFTNKFIMSGSTSDFSEKELEFYIQECSKIVKLDGGVVDAKEILYTVGVQIAHFKSIDTIK